MTEQFWNSKGMVFDIQRFSIHDGPGIRTIVFLKGCPLRCVWCSNPESQSVGAELLVLADKCKGCRRCEEVCPLGAIRFQPGFRLDRDVCEGCGQCAEVCPTGALQVSGRVQKVDEIIQVLKRDEVYYRRSGGGVTLSGGEPLMHPAFAADLLRTCKEIGWHTAMETSGFSGWSAFEKVLPWLDLVLLDIKHVDDEKHVRYIGQSNRMILENARRLGENGVPVVIRVPVVPGCNDTPEEIRRIASFARSIPGVRELHLLPYHRLGEMKYRYLDAEYPLTGQRPPVNQVMEALRIAGAAEGLHCQIGG